MEKENRLSKHTMNLIISNIVLNKGPAAFAINSGNNFASTQHNHKDGSYKNSSVKGMFVLSMSKSVLSLNAFLHE
jgi:hypothetical protein